MGKSLIIKGADFSQNAIEQTVVWYNIYSDLVKSIRSSSGTFGQYAPRASAITELGLMGKPINLVKLNIEELPPSGIIRIGTANVTAIDVTPFAYTEIKSYEYIVTEGINTINLNEEITLSEGMTIFVYGLVYYNRAGATSGNTEGFQIVYPDRYPSENIVTPIQFGYKQMG